METSAVVHTHQHDVVGSVMVRNLDETMLRGEEEVVYENTLALALAMLAQELVRLTQGLVVAEVCSLAEEADLR